MQNLTKRIPYQWKIQGWTKAKDKAICVAYIDSRDVQELLDEEVGAMNWSDNIEFVAQWEDMVEYKCTLSIYDEKRSLFISKSDIGSFQIEKYKNADGVVTSTNNEMAHKGAASDAFKRAAVKFGIGRFLYDLDVVYITKEEYEANKYKLTEFINRRTKVDTARAAEVVFASEATSKFLKPKTFDEFKKLIEETSEKKALAVIATEINLSKGVLTKDQVDELRSIYNAKDKNLA